MTKNDVKPNLQFESIGSSLPERKKPYGSGVEILIECWLKVCVSDVAGGSRQRIRQNRL